MNIYYYQRLNEIGKEVALITSDIPITDTIHYREITKEYYEAVLEFLREQAEMENDNDN